MSLTNAELLERKDEILTEVMTFELRELVAAVAGIGLAVMEAKEEGPIHPALDKFIDRASDLAELFE